MRHLFTLGALLLICSCSETNPEPEKPVASKERELKNVRADSTPVKKAPVEDTLQLEKQLRAQGLVNVRELDSSIHVELKYAEKDNFLGYAVYGKLKNCYVQPELAEKLVKAEEILHKKYPYYFLVLYDGVRPLSIQKIMWDTLKMPAGIKQKYLSDPAKGSLHNYGVAIDLSIEDADGVALDMGTKYDFFGELAHPEFEEKFVEEGRLSHRQMFNRELLRDVMAKAGLMKIETEWWHFNSCSRQEAMKQYKIVE